MMLLVFFLKEKQETEKHEIHEHYDLKLVHMDHENETRAQLFHVVGQKG